MWNSVKMDVKKKSPARTGGAFCLIKTPPKKGVMITGGDRMEVTKQTSQTVTDGLCSPNCESEPGAD